MQVLTGAASARVGDEGEQLLRLSAEDRLQAVLAAAQAWAASLVV